MDDDSMPGELRFSAGLGPLPEAGMTEVNPYLDLGSLDPHGGKQVLTWYSADQTRAYAAQEVVAECERYKRAIEALHWMPRVPGRWDETDVAHAEGFNKAKAEAIDA